MLYLDLNLFRRDVQITDELCSDGIGEITVSGAKIVRVDLSVSIEQPRAPIGCCSWPIPEKSGFGSYRADVIRSA
jgi:hypothetical protein